ncbi:hypothetical protein ARSEF4850_000059 [Beauveria asiatica]
MFASAILVFLVLVHTAQLPDQSQSGRDELDSSPVHAQANTASNMYCKTVWVFSSSEIATRD